VLHIIETVIIIQCLVLQNHQDGAQCLLLVFHLCRECDRWSEEHNLM